MAQHLDCRLLDLDPDVLLALLSLLGPQDLLRVGATCHSLREIARSDYLWMMLSTCWAKDVNLGEWRAGVKSTQALFRLLRSFDPIVGLWTAKYFGPRGSLLHVTWGTLSLIACKVFGLETGELKLRRLFEVVGLHDGSFKVELFIKDTNGIGVANIRFPANLVWASTIEPEFVLESSGLYKDFGIGGVPFESEENNFLRQLQAAGLRNNQEQRPFPRPDISGDEVIADLEEPIDAQPNAERRIDFLQHRLWRRTSLAFDDNRSQHQEQSDLSFSQQALHYLIRLAPSGRSFFAFRGHPNGESSSKLGHTARCFYKRLTVAESSATMEFVGLWSGIYGPHGIEIINVTYTDEEIIGTKVLGDPNVPCGQASFKVRLSLETLDVPVELQQIVDRELEGDVGQFRIVKLYNGHGRIAGHNFQNPLWVPGHLLVSESGQIAFLWEGVNFVVPFHKLNLAVFYNSQNKMGKIL